MLYGIGLVLFAHSMRILRLKRQSTNSSSLPILVALGLLFTICSIHMTLGLAALGQRPSSDLSPTTTAILIQTPVPVWFQAAQIGLYASAVSFESKVPLSVI